MGSILRFEEEQANLCGFRQISLNFMEDAFINWLEEIRDFQYANGERLNSVYSHVGKTLETTWGTSCVCIGLTNIADQRRFMTPPFQISRKLRRSLWFQTILTILTLFLS
jgi:hypothetical protein